MAFLQIDKDLFKLGLNPTEILILAQSLEYQRNTGDCFMSDKAFAEMLTISTSTVSRAIGVLEKKEYISRETKNIKGGKERHIKVNTAKIEADLTSIKMTVDGVSQASNCSLSNVNLPIDNKQNDLIKENIKDNTKENKEYSSEAVEEEIAEVDRTVAMTMWDKNDYIIKDNIITFKPNTANYGKLIQKRQDKEEQKMKEPEGRVKEIYEELLSM